MGVEAEAQHRARMVQKSFDLVVENKLQGMQSGLRVELGSAFGFKFKV